MERFSDKTRAVLYALLVHLVSFAFLFFGLLWTQTAQPISIPGAVIEATLVGPPAAPKPRAAAPPKPAPPKPEPPPPPKPPEPQPTPPQRNDPVTREKVVDVAQQKAEQAQKVEQERIHQEQIRLQDEQKREAADRERLKQLEDIRKQREAAERARKLAQEKLVQLNDLQKPPAKPVKAAPAELPDSDQPRTGMAGQDDSLSAQYYAAIQNAVTQNWLRPDTAPPGLHCLLRIVQIPGGDVLSVDITNPCNADPQTRTSIEQAVKRAAPLPYKGYEKVFQRTINFNFTYDG